MAGTRTASERITEEVTTWPGVEAGPGRRGEFAFRLGRRELGHLHGDHAAHFFFPGEVGTALREAGRVVDHPVFPGKTGPAARRIEDDADVRDVIELLRLNYDRTVARFGLPQAGKDGGADAEIPGLHALGAEPLPFAPALDVRAFLLERPRGNILIYSTTALSLEGDAIAALGGASRRYLNHWHEALFPSALDAPLFVNAADRKRVAEAMPVRAAFSKRHRLDEDFEVIPIPGHTPGATAYLWDTGAHRLLFTGDTIYLNDGEWSAAVLESSDRDAYIESLELMRDLEFDVLVPWAATRGGPPHARTDRADIQRRIGAMIARLRFGEDR